MIIKRIKRKFYYLLSLLLILFFSALLFSLYSKKNVDKLNLISEEYFQNRIYKVLSELSYKSLNGQNVEDILNVYKNAEGEILYVDYDLSKSYELLKKITENIRTVLGDGKSNIVYDIPFFVGSNNIFLVNLGPKLKLNIDYINSILTNVDTKITNYGLNNALVQVYVKIIVEGRILTPVSSKNKKVTYDLLVDSKIINGRIPEFYGNCLTSSSSIFDVPIK